MQTEPQGLLPSPQLQKLIQAEPVFGRGHKIGDEAAICAEAGREAIASFRPARDRVLARTADQGISPVKRSTQWIQLSYRHCPICVHLAGRILIPACSQVPFGHGLYRLLPCACGGQQDLRSIVRQL